MKQEFPSKAPCAAPTFYRTYSRVKEDGTKESFEETIDRTVRGLDDLGGLSEEDLSSITQHQRDVKVTTSGRWLWVGGSEWLKSGKGSYGAFNCFNIYIDDEEDLCLNEDLLMQGGGVGRIIIDEGLSKMKPLLNKKFSVDISPSSTNYGGMFMSSSGQCFDMDREDSLLFQNKDGSCTIVVGDSRLGWVDLTRKYLALVRGEAITSLTNESIKDWNGHLLVDLSYVRPQGTPLKGFGGKANPVGLPLKIRKHFDIFNRLVNHNDGRWNSKEASLFVNESALAIIAGNIRRSAGLDGFASTDEPAKSYKDNLWMQNDEDEWIVDPERDAFRMANHTIIYHHRPTLEEIEQSLTKQHASGEGAIMFAPESIARCSSDLLPTREAKNNFIEAYINGEGETYLRQLAPHESDYEINHRMMRYGFNPLISVAA